MVYSSCVILFFLRIKVLVAVDGINGFWREARIRVAGKKEVSSITVKSV